MAQRLETGKNTVATQSDVSPFQTINAVEEAVSEKVHGGAMNVPSELEKLGLRATIDQNERTGRKREARRTR